MNGHGSSNKFTSSDHRQAGSHPNFTELKKPKPLWNETQIKLPGCYCTLLCHKAPPFNTPHLWMGMQQNHWQTRRDHLATMFLDTWVLDVAPIVHTCKYSQLKHIYHPPKLVIFHDFSLLFDQLHHKSVEKIPIMPWWKVWGAWGGMSHNIWRVVNFWSYDLGSSRAVVCMQVNTHFLPLAHPHSTPGRSPHKWFKTLECITCTSPTYLFAPDQTHVTMESSHMCADGAN